VDPVEEELVEEWPGVPAGSVPHVPNERPVDEPDPTEELAHPLLLQGATSAGANTQISIVTALGRARPPLELTCCSGAMRASQSN